MLTPKLKHRLMRKRRIRAKVRGTAARPRLSVYRSLRNMYAQLIDDDAGRTLVAGSLRDLGPRGTKGSLRGAKAPARRPVPRSPKGEVGSAKSEGGKLTVENAAKLGKVIAEKAKKKKIEKVVFDRNAYTYHGRIKALADAAREGGLQF